MRAPTHVRRFGLAVQAPGALHPRRLLAHDRIYDRGVERVDENEIEGVLTHLGGGLYMRRVRWQLAGFGDRGRGGLWHQECGYSEVSLSFVLDL